MDKGFVAAVMVLVLMVGMFFGFMAYLAKNLQPMQDGIQCYVANVKCATH